ncbi:MAG: hypothetical protein ACE5I1_29865, partial [bacterium]
ETEFEKALISLAYAMYYICESSTMPFLLSDFWARQEDQGSIFANPFDMNHTIKLVGHGVGTFLYYRFTNLTPMIGYRKQTRELYSKWKKDYGHPANWTARNAGFCLNFCIDTALKFQREPDEGYSLVYYTDVFEDVIEPAEEKATIWNISERSSHLAIGKPTQTREVLLSLQKGHSLVGFAHEMEETPDEWTLIIRNWQGKPGNSQRGFVAKEEVSIRRREIQGAKEVPN